MYTYIYVYTHIIQVYDIYVCVYIYIYIYTHMLFLGNRYIDSATKAATLTIDGVVTTNNIDY